MKDFLQFGVVLMFCGMIWSCFGGDVAMNLQKDEVYNVNDFFTSEYGVTTLEKHNLGLYDLMIDSMKVEVFKPKGVTLFLIPIIKDGVIIGKLNIFNVPGEEPYRAIVEKKDNPGEFNCTTVISTGYGVYLATLKESNTKTQKIVDVAPLNEIDIRGGAREGWWRCTARVYSMAKQACGNDDQCNFLCDLVDLAGGCTISIAAAAAISCM